MTPQQLNAIKLGLEALEAYGKRHRATYLLGGAWDEEITLGDKAITALKEALAQPEQEPKRTGMVYYKNDACQAKDAYSHDCICWTKAQPEQVPVIDKSAAKRIATALGWTPQRTEQEPVAWTLLLTGEHTGMVGMAGEQFVGAPNYYQRVNVYTASPQRKPLSDEEIKKCWDSAGYTGIIPKGFARAIEAAHGIKENT